MSEELTTDRPDLDANDMIWAKEMADALHTAYPGHLWAVTCEGAQGIATVRNLALSGNWGFVIRLDEAYSMSEFKKMVVRGGGEILERYKLRRGAADHDAIAALNRDLRGNAIGDKSR